MPRRSSARVASQCPAHADICAVIVTYNPDSSFEQNVRALLPQVGKLVIVDNQSSSATHSRSRESLPTAEWK